MIQFKKIPQQQSSETPRKILKQSRTWHNNTNITSSHPKNTNPNIKNISSQPEMQKALEPIIELEKIELISQVQNLFNLPFLLIDKDLKPVIYNTAFDEAFLLNNNISVEYAIKNIKVKRLDKVSQKIVKTMFCETLNQRQQFNRSISQPNTYPIYTVSSKPVQVQFLNLLQILNQSHNSCTIIDHQSQLITNDYQIDIKYNSGYYIFFFSKVGERDDYKNKINTKVLMNQLFKSLSHEFSTSLNCIQILAENALEELPLAIVTKYIRPLLNSCYILNSIVQDVKDFSLILSKNFTLTIKNTNISKLITDAASLFQSQLEMKGLNFIIEADNLHVHTDSQRVRQSLINLLSNAQKFTQKGCIKITANEEILKDQRFVKIVVEDTGPGIEQEIQSQLRQFLKSNTRNKFREKNQSYGMGLLITEKIVKGLTLVHEGGINFESNSQGSKFWFYVEDLQSLQITDQNSKQTIKYKQLNSIYSVSKFEPSFPLSPSVQEFRKSYSPLCSLKFNKESQNFFYNQSSSLSFSESKRIIKLDLSFQDEKSDQIINPYVMKQAFQKSKKSSQEITDNHSQETKILVVDDEFVNIYALRIMLNRMNYLCDTASNGIEALDKFSNNYYYLIFMDIEMPIMSGIQATKKIFSFCELNNIVKPIVIAQTAYTDLLTKQTCYESGMKYFLQKPIHTNEIKTILDDLL